MSENGPETSAAWILAVQDWRRQVLELRGEAAPAAAACYLLDTAKDADLVHVWPSRELPARPARQLCPGMAIRAGERTG